MSKGKNFMSNHHIDSPFSSENQFQEMKILNCSFKKIKYWEYPDSWFRHWCFYWNASPGAWIVSGGKKIELTPDRVLLIPPFTPFASGMDHTFSHFYVHFYSPGVLDRIRRVPIILKAGNAAEVIPAAMKKQGIPQMLGIYSVLFSYLSKIPQQYCLADTEETIDPRIRKVVNLMYEHISASADNRRFFRLAGLGINEFYNLFKKEMHRTPRQYLVMLRMEHASVLLRRSQSSIEEIAENCGYADRYHFSKAFRSYFGLPPAEFRSRHEQ